MMNRKLAQTQQMAAELTKASSRQTYYTILLLADRDLRGEAYCAYGYFRWVDDVLDGTSVSQEEKRTFLQRQKQILASGHSDELVLCPEEEILLALLQGGRDRSSGLWSYLENMMAVMEFDLERRGRLVSEADLTEYSRRLATSVMDGLMYFIGHDQPTPNLPGKYDAVTAAHITHMLRDTYEDAKIGYFNIPAGFLQQHGISAQDVASPFYRTWVCQQVKLAWEYFKSGREFISQIKHFRRRLAGLAYAARFEWVLGVIERDHSCLRSDYSQRKSLRAALEIGWIVLVSFLGNGSWYHRKYNA